MKPYQFDETTEKYLKDCCIPFAVFQQVNGRVIPLLFSNGACELFAISRERAMDELTHHLFDNDHPDDVARLGNAVHSFAKEESDLDLLYRAKSGEGLKIVHICGRHVYLEDGTRLAVVWYMDEGAYTGDKKELFDQVMDTMLYQARKQVVNEYEPMTGLPQVNYFFRLAGATCGRMRAAGEQPVLMYFDFNDMKGYNQKHSFAKGDLLLLGLRDTLVKHFSNQNCCRLGGDHFIVLGSAAGLEEVLEEIFSDVAAINHGESAPVRVGICLNIQEDGNVGPALDLAKMAADQNRESPVSAYSYYTEELTKTMQLRSYLLENLDKALKEGWVQVYFQPLVRTVNGKVSDEEALARWIDPTLGFLSPADFVPALEESGMIYKLDLFVVEQVLAKMKTMSEKGYYIVPNSVNISRADFRACDIVKEITKRVDAAGISRDMLTIEITESAIAENLDYIREQVTNLKALGFHVWMDDYGSGYSSPDLLPSFQFDTIKLDMQFMRHFEKGEKSRIILSELIKMAMNLGMETVVEGVETAEQVEFLKEVGATKMQGFYFCRPIPLKEIYRRYEVGDQIGFENPEESGYYSKIGQVNLYDISLSSNENEGIGEYFNTLPMAIFEVGESDVAIIRCNRSYQTMLGDVFQMHNTYVRVRLDTFGNGYGALFMRTLSEVAVNGGQQIIDERTADRKKLKALIRKLAENPVNHVNAVVVIMLDISDDNEVQQALTYAGVAQALSADYINLYHVDLETEYFIEYRPDSGRGEIAEIRNGDRFFATSRKDAETYLHPDDRADFINAFTKENVVATLRAHGVFIKTYRLLTEDGWMYVNMKAIRIGKDGNHIIIGVNNVDAQMKQRAIIERLREERLVYSRICALSGEYISFYTVNPETGHYMVFNAASDYRNLGLSGEGDDFFAESLTDAQNVICKEDLPLFRERFTKENVLKEIAEKGSFHLKYGLLLKKKPHPVILKAAMTVENGEERLIVGIRNGGGVTPLKVMIQASKEKNTRHPGDRCV